MRNALVELPCGSIINWEFCKKNGCENRRSLRLNSEYCHPHSMSDKTAEEIIEELESVEEPVTQKP